MHSDSDTRVTLREGLPRAAVMFAVAILAGWAVRFLGTPSHPVTTQQVTAVAVFVLIISATLLFWTMRLAIAFLGIAVMLGAKVMTLPQMVEKTELHIILFLVGMMTLVGVLKDLGLFTWMIQSIINAKRMTGRKFTLILILLSGIMPGVVDEVTSIVFVLALVFQVCDTLKLRATPFVLMSVLATNIGSTGTMLGNPVGILIGSKAGLTFGDFLLHATPITLLSLLGTLLLVVFWFRKDIALLDERLEKRRHEQLGLGPLVRIPYRRGLCIMLGALTLIALHHHLEQKLGVPDNTMLIVAPLAISGLLMIYRNRRARHYIEAEVEWWTLLFFMMLFAVAGALETTGVTEAVAVRFTSTFGTNRFLLTPLVVGTTALGSAFVDNIVFVAAFIPVIKSLVAAHPDLHPLWWAMLFGACFGGNITAIGSTANIVALGMLEKRYGTHIGFMEWLKIGIVVGAITCVVATLVILLFYFGDPTSAETARQTLEQMATPVTQSHG